VERAKAAMTETRRASRRKRFALTLLAATAAFVIIFQFLALQLQGAGSLATGGRGAAQATSVRAAAGTSITSRASGAGPTSAVTSSVQGAPASRPVSAHGRHFHPVTTHSSGAATRANGEGDDL